jgi:hypothetical protein
MRSEVSGTGLFTARRDVTHASRGLAVGSFASTSLGKS